MGQQIGEQLIVSIGIVEQVPVNRTSFQKLGNVYLSDKGLKRRNRDIAQSSRIRIS